VCRYLIPLLAIASALPAERGSRLDLRAERLRTGIFRYRTLVGSGSAAKEAGQSQIEIRKLGASGNFRYTNLVLGSFSQSWEAISSASFVPVSAKLIFGQGDTAFTAFDLAYRDNRVSGFAASRDDHAQRPVDQPVASDTVDQRIDWAAVMSLKKYVRGKNFMFHVYDPGTGNSSVFAQISGFETISVPAGRFETVRSVYRIDKNRGAETYTVFVKAIEPRFLVKEEFPNSAVTELVEMKP